MNDFLQYLADRKYGYYYGLYKLRTHALTEEECTDRIQRIARYKELINLIDNLPVEHKQVVDKLFDEKMLSA